MHEVRWPIHLPGEEELIQVEPSILVQVSAGKLRSSPPPPPLGLQPAERCGRRYLLRRRCPHARWRRTHVARACYRAHRHCLKPLPRVRPPRVAVLVPSLQQPVELLKADVLLLLLCITNGAGVDPVGTILVPLFVTLKPSNAEDLRENRIKKRKD